LKNLKSLGDMIHSEFQASIYNSINSIKGVIDYG